MSVAHAAVAPAVFLVAAGDQQALVRFPVAPCSRAWDGIFDSFALLRDRYDICVRVEEARNSRSRFRAGLTILVWCETPESYRTARDLTVQAIAFVPSHLTSLDARRMARATLIMNAPVEKGEIIQAQDLGTSHNGSGVDVSFRDVFVGQRAAYDLAQGEALDFGKILDD